MILMMIKVESITCYKLQILQYEPYLFIYLFVCYHVQKKVKEFDGIKIIRNQFQPGNVSVKNRFLHVFKPCPDQNSVAQVLTIMLESAALIPFANALCRFSVSIPPRQKESDKSRYLVPPLSIRVLIAMLSTES